jgi:hypothetical protein
MTYKVREGMVWFIKLGHHANFVAGIGMLCAVLWYLSDLLQLFVPDPVWGTILVGIFKGVFGFSALLLFGTAMIVTWKFAQKLWK